MAGRMGMSEKEFRHTTPRYFYFKQKGFEALQLEHWQRARLEAFYSFLPHAKKGAMNRPSDLFKLPGDEKEINFSEEAKAAMIAHLKRAKGVDFFAGETIPKGEA